MDIGRRQGEKEHIVVDIGTLIETAEELAIGLPSRHEDRYTEALRVAARQLLIHSETEHGLLEEAGAEVLRKGTQLQRFPDVLALFDVSCAIAKPLSGTDNERRFSIALDAKGWALDVDRGRGEERGLEYLVQYPVDDLLAAQDYVPEGVIYSEDDESLRGSTVMLLRHAADLRRRMDASE